MSEIPADIAPSLSAVLHDRPGHRRHWNGFAAWAAVAGFAVLPADGRALAAYLAHLAGKGKTPGTLDRARRAVLYVHRRLGLAEPALTGSLAVVEETGGRRGPGGVNLENLHPQDRAIVAQAIADGYSEHTRRAYRRHWRAFAAWAVESEYGALPSADDVLARWLLSLSEDGKAVATVRQARAAVVFAHRAAGWDSPAGLAVRRALKGIGRRTGRPQRQAAPLSAEGLAAIRATAHLPRPLPSGRIESRDRARDRAAVDVALASVLRDGLLRISEAAALTWADVSRDKDGTGALLIRRSKTDPESVGKWVYLGKAATAALWGIRTGAPSSAPVFGMGDRQLQRRVKAMSVAAGLYPPLSGHSGRVGMAQSLSASGAGLPDIMQAGRWGTSRMVARYTEKQALSRGAVARYYGAKGA